VPKPAGNFYWVSFNHWGPYVWYRGRHPGQRDDEDFISPLFRKRTFRRRPRYVLRWVDYSTATVGWNSTVALHQTVRVPAPNPLVGATSVGAWRVMPLASIGARAGCGECRGMIGWKRTLFGSASQPATGSDHRNSARAPPFEGGLLSRFVRFWAGIWSRHRDNHWSCSDDTLVNGDGHECTHWRT